jgi:hypothetical protein
MSEDETPPEILAAITPALPDDGEEIKNEETPNPRTPTVPKLENTPTLDVKETKNEQTTTASISTAVMDRPTPNTQELRNPQSLVAWVPAISFPPAPTIPYLDPRRTPEPILALLECLSPSDLRPPRPTSAPPKLQFAFAPYYNPDDAERWRIEMAKRVSLDHVFEEHRHEDPAAPYCPEQEQIMINAAENESKADSKKDNLYSPDQDFFPSDPEEGDSGDEEVDEEDAQENDY